MARIEGNGDLSGCIRIGVGGWTYAPWRGTFYPADLPQKNELKYAAGNLSSIEINGTFYGSQKPATFAKWRDETPEDFVFAVKAPRYATHRSRLGEAGATIERFIDGGVLELGAKLGPINWQLMPTTQFDPGDMEKFLELLPRHAGGRDLKHAIEVRHESFRTERFIDLARRHEVAVIIAGDSKYPQIVDLTADFVYLRIMGTKAKHPAGYAPAELSAWTKRVDAYAKGGLPEDFEPISPLQSKPVERDVYLYVISGEKALNPAAARELIRRLAPGR